MFDTAAFHPTLPAERVSTILAAYEFALDDEVWLRETFGLPSLSSRDIELREIEHAASRLSGAQGPLAGLVARLAAAMRAPRSPE